MKNITKKKERILYVETKEIKLLDVPRAMDENGYDVYRASFSFSAQGYLQEAEMIVKHAIEEYDIQYVVSYDFSESIAQACYETDVSYIAWVYDAPQKELYTHYALYPSNYIFVFDKMQQKRLQEKGIRNVYHMPLAILGNKIKQCLNEKSKGQKAAEITFVGQLYRVGSTEFAIEKADEDVKIAMKKNIQECLLQWNDTVQLHSKMEDCCVRYFDMIDQGKVSKNYPYMTEQFYYEAAVTSRLLANKERVAILNSLAEKYDVRFYTNDKDVSQLSSKVKILPGLRYDDELSKVYRDSKININITLHCIETGACQRIFDVMAAGGFMLSNYQKELEELFVVGEEIVLYHNLEELETLVEYYLNHEKERNRIAAKGQAKVLSSYDFHERMEQVMDVVTKNEKRELPYLLIDRRLVIRQVNEILMTATEQSYHKLIALLNELKYQTVVEKTAELRMLTEMLKCWNTEMETGVSNIFVGIKNVNEAEKKYLAIKHLLWRLESGISEERCREDIYNLCQKKESKLLIAWISKANLKKWEEIIVIVSLYMQEVNFADAIELLSYGILLSPGNTEMLLQKANCFMELGMWQKTLDTLSLVEEPNEEIQGLIVELTAVLGGTENE